MTSSRCDLHLHSSASSANEEWYSRRFGCPESYASPREQYALCKARGMTLVTLTDHDTIAGGLELIDHGDFFLSEEVSAVFPEDGCAIHVLAWNITPAQHDRLQAARPSVYDVLDVLHREHIVHACAHPLVSPNGKLGVEALEKIVSMFPILEGTNGLTDRRLQRQLQELVGGLGADARATLARRHRVARPARTSVLVAGSDAHTARHAGSAYTSVPAPGLAASELLAAVDAGQATCCGQAASLDVMCTTVGRVTYGFLDGRRRDEPGYRDPFVDFVDVLAGRASTPGDAGLPDELVRSFVAGAARAAAPRGPHVDLDAGTSTDEVMTAMRRAHDGLIGHAFEELVDGIGDVDMYRVLGALRDAAGAVITAIPFAFAADHFARQHRQAIDVLSAWRASPRPPAHACLALFSDSVDQVDGVTSSLRRFVRRARGDGRHVRIPYCGARPPGADDDIYAPLAAAASCTTHIYDGLELHLPSPLGAVDWLWRNDITEVELATPGPMGLVGLLAGRLMRLPVTASYHTDLPQLLGQLSTSPLLHSAARTYTAWFYRAVDRVTVFSERSRQRVLELGVPAHRIELVAVAIDPQEFSPARARPDVFRSLGVRVHREPVVLSVGRLSPEKNLPVIIEAVGKLQELARPPVLVIVGDGPERAALARLCAGRPYVALVGTQEGDVLKQLYASAHAFVFASRIDTLGLVTLEAMSSGTPVVVPSDAAIAELVEDGVSGLCYEHGVDDLSRAISDLLQFPARRARMARAARKAMIERWTEDAGRASFGRSAL